MSMSKGDIHTDNLMTPSGTEKGKRDPRMAPGLSKFATTTSTFLRKVADGTIDEAGRSGVFMDGVCVHGEEYHE